MDAKSALKQIRNGFKLPVYVLYGPETYLIDRFIEQVKAHLLPNEDDPFAVSKFDLSQTPVEAVIEDAETMPFMASCKIILATQARLFTGVKDKGKVEHDMDRLLTYIQSAVDYSVILFVVNEEKLDERKKIVKLLKQKGAVIAFQKLTFAEIEVWLERQATRLQCQLDKEAGTMLAQRTGPHLQRLAAEMEKLSILAGVGGTITEEMIDQLVAKSTEENVFMLVEHIAEKRFDQALALLHELLNQREEPIKIVSLISRQYRLILIARALDDQGRSGQQIASVAGIPPFAVRNILKQGRHYSEVQLSRILADLAQLDYEMKTGRTDKVAGLEMFLLQLAG